MYTPYPPCFHSEYFNDAFEFSTFCVHIGKLGTQYFDDNRKSIMMFATSITFVCMILSIVSLMAVSDSDEHVRSTCWTYGESNDGVKIYIGLNKIVIDNSNGTMISALWGDSSCDNIAAGGSDNGFCNECREACDSSVIVAIMSLVTILPTITTDIQRSTRKGDLNCQKFMGIVTGILSLMSTIAALSSFAGGCNNNLPTNFNGKQIDYKYGPGFICLFIATVLKVVDIVANTFLPVRPYSAEEEADYLCALPDPPGVVVDAVVRKQAEWAKGGTAPPQVEMMGLAAVEAPVPMGSAVAPDVEQGYSD